MNKNTTNILGIIIAILAGTYFFVMYCNLCSSDDGEVAQLRATAEVKSRQSALLS